MNELLQHLFTFNGRVNRARLWLAVLFYVVIGLILEFLTPLAGRVLGETGRSVIFGSLNLVLFASFLSLQARRLHDRNRSALWLSLQCLPYAFLLVFLYLAAKAADPVDEATLLHLASLMPWASIPVWVLVLWFFVELFCLRGTIGPNRFGPDPLTQPSAETLQMRPTGD